MLVSFKNYNYTRTINLDNITDFWDQDYYESYSKNTSYRIAFILTRDNSEVIHFIFKTKYSRDYNYRRILDMYGVVGALILEDVNEDEQIIEEFK